MPISQRVIELSEMYADGRCSHDELIAASMENYQRAAAKGDELTMLGCVAANLAVVDPTRNGIQHLTVAQAVRHAAENTSHFLRLSAGNELPVDVREELARQASLLREVVGNPFRAVASSFDWRTTSVLERAEVIYEQNAFDHLPRLADAVQDAGCNNANLLNHLRRDGPHVRGCWALDLVLGKS
jgi:hypothetical protein